MLTFTSNHCRITAILFFAFFVSLKTVAQESGVEKGGLFNAAEAARFEKEITKDPVLGRVPRERLVHAMDKTEASRSSVNMRSTTLALLNWSERGPSADVVGPSNGNTRAGSAVTAGRIRAIWVDRADPSGNTVLVGGVGGGLWKTTNISANPANWTVVNDYLSNLAVSFITQDPTNSNIMYFCTGESYFNADAIEGLGVFKSTDHGVTWNHLPSTASFKYSTRILCDYLGNVYLATRGSGLLRSTDGGTTWTNITPSGMVSDICDLEISSTTSAGRLHVVSGIFSTQTYRYTDIPVTVTSGAGWNAPAAAFPSYAMRCEIAVSGNILYACPVDASYQVPTIYKSTNGGANWVSTGGQPTSGWANGQGWYDVAIGIDPSNSDNCIVGGLENYKTTNGGTSWTKISNWVGTTGQYVHADVHDITWYANGDKLLIGCDGGVHYSTDKGATFSDRNTGLRIKQFYAVAIHPTTTNYFLAGAQDNGSHQLTSPGLGTSVEVTGGDGAFVHIDQNEPQYQFTSYIRNQYRRSINGGANWTSINLSTAGLFINPTDYDNTANIMYCSNSAGTFRRWTNPQSGSASASVTITTFSTNFVSAVTVSPYTSNRVYFGTNSQSPAFAATKLCYINNANTIASGSAATDISTGLPTNVTTSCIAVGTSDNNLMVCYSNYGVQQIWLSTNGGTSWTNIDGNLPDMPVRWCMFYPGNNTKAYIATETGVWETDLINGSSTVWVANPTFPVVKTTMLQYRSSDGTIIASTHGRGLFTATLPDFITTLNLKLYLEGFYTGGGSMVANRYDLGLNADPTATDSITVNLWSPASLSNPNPDYSINALLHTDGTATMQFPAAVNGGSYYIAVKHRNTMETWSKNPVAFTNTTLYDFSDGLNKAYDDGVNPPMKNMGSGIYAIYSGDVNKDGAVDASDMSEIDNDIAGFAFGYNDTDVSGDGATDASDLSVVDNNQSLFLFYARPF